MKLVRVPLRVSFIGGGSDLPAHYETYGGAVVSATINKYIYITSKPQSGLFPHKYRLAYSQLEHCNTSDEIKHPIIHNVVKEYNIESLDLDVVSDVPAGTGLGSSSAFTVGLHNILGDREMLDAESLADNACYTEIDALKEPIGKQDQYAAAYGGLNLIEFEKSGVTITKLTESGYQSALESRLTLIYLGRTRNASKILKAQTLNHRTLNEMADAARWFSTYLKAGALEICGDIIKEGWELKKSLSPNASNPLIDTIIETAINNGAISGKLLGAGETGFVLLYCSPYNRHRMLGGLRHLNLRYVPFAFDYEGSKVLYED